MNDIEMMLKMASKEEIKIPRKVHHRVQNTLKTKNDKKKYYVVKKFITTVATLIVIFIGTVGIYAASGGKIGGKPVIEMLGIKFSDEYENYRVDVEGQKLLNNKKTSIELIGTVCDDGFTTLEFYITLSKEDKEKLRLEKPILKDGDIEIIKNNDDIDKAEKQRIINEFSGKTVDTLEVSFNNKLVTDETGTYLESFNNFNAIIDGESKWIRPRAVQSVAKISDYEYKVYQMYFLTDKEIGDKKEFTVTLEDVVITTRQTPYGENEVYIPIEGKFDVKVSKEKASSNTQITVPKCDEIKYKNMTKKVEKVLNTPLQTIVKVYSIYENVSLRSLESSKDENYVSIINYATCNEKKKELETFSYETKRVVTYSDGRVEEWEQRDIGTSENFKNAKMETEEYIIIEKDNTSSKINITAREMLDTNKGQKHKEIGKFEISLNSEINVTE